MAVGSPTSPVRADTTTRFGHLSARTGLSHNTVMCVRPDRQGFLWIGTRDGLNRYDGYRFITYRPDPTNPTRSLTHNWITDLYETTDGTLWLTTLGGGLHRLAPDRQRFTNFRIDPQHISDRNLGYAVRPDRQGSLWIASRGGLNRFDPKTGQYQLFPSPDTRDSAVMAVCEDRAGRLWVGTETGLYQLDRQRISYKKILLDAVASFGSVTDLNLDRSGWLWVVNSTGGVWAIDQQGTVKQYMANGPNLHLPSVVTIRHVYPDSLGFVWLTSVTGLRRLDPRTGAVTLFQADPTQTDGLSSNFVLSVVRDRAGVVWIGSNNGLNSLLPQPRKFRTEQVVADETSARLPENGIRSLCIDRRGTIWLANWTGKLLYRQPTESTFHPVRSDSTDAHALAGDRTGGLLEDRAGRLWAWGGQFLQLMDKARPGRVLMRYRCPMWVRWLQEGADGRIWLAGRGVGVFDPKTGVVRLFRHDPAKPHSLPTEGVVTVLPVKYDAARRGQVWIASFNRGLILLDEKTGRFRQFTPDLTHKPGQLNDYDIRSLFEDRAGRLWVGTNQGGLNVFDPKTERFTAFTTHDGLPSNHIAGIMGDSAGRLWLTTNQGVCRFDSRTRTVRTYDASDGLQDNEFYEVAGQSPDGKLFVAGPNGFNRFDPAQISDNPVVPPVQITGIQVLNQPRPLTNGPLELDHTENFISFDFVALNFVMSDKNQYAYQLVGVDKTWISCGTRRFASYTNLDPGDYTFRVRGSNNDGVWNLVGTSMQVVIRPPFWQRWWFLVGCVLALAGLIYTGLQLRIRQVERAEARKTEVNRRLAAMEMQALRAQMNPHFIFNSLNSINRFILRNESDAASDYLSKFAKLIRLILQNSNAPTVPLDQELEALTLYLTLEALRFEDKFTFHIHVDPQIDTAHIDIPPLVIQPYVENAIWHGLLHKPDGGGQLLIELQQTPDGLSCVIEDNGVGRARSAELKSKSATRNKSMGMQITAQRLALSHTLTGKQTTVTVEDLVTLNGEPAGTRVTLNLKSE